MEFYWPFPKAGTQVRRLLVCLICLLSIPIWSAGTGTLQTADSDPVMLFVGQETFGNFASYNGPENSRLNFRIRVAGETAYFGLGRAYKADGTPESFGQYQYRVKSAATGAVVFGPHTININSENLTTLGQAIAGPAVLNPLGYPTGEEFVFVAPTAGDYYVEFDQIGSRPRYIGLWDITITNNDQLQTGRVYSKNWSFRVPEVVPELPYCSFGAELRAAFYSYTNDGFVTRIDFADSGFQPLSFNLAFNRVGPGTTGDLGLDRRSVPFVNATDNAAEHLIFLEAPDPVLFPDGQCGIAAVSGQLRCTGGNEFCIPVTFTEAGQVDILLDFNGNGIYDADQDRILVYAAEENDLDPCVPWDGLLANGNPPAEGTLVDIQLSFAQGVQHWSLYDGELMRNGFCVEPIRPACSVSASTSLYYDDIDIVEDPGAGGAKQQLDGCDCQTENCRTWTNFEANAEDDCRIVDSRTTGYGDRNTLNTWWSAFSVRSSQFDIPVTMSGIEGPVDHCPGEAVDVRLALNTSNEIEQIRWTGPAGPLPANNDLEEISVNQSGLYTATIIDDAGCSSTSNYALSDVICSLNARLISVDCSDGGTDTDPTDDTYTATVRVEGDNSGFYTYNGNRYAYGQNLQIGPYLISAGDVVFTAADEFYACCSESIAIPAPPPCSDGCAITSVSITSVDCLDGGTATDPTDDQFTFTMVVNGINVGEMWVDEEAGWSGRYGVENTFGPFPISEGTRNYYFQDENDPNCAIAATVQPPRSCSNVCVLTPSISNLVCRDNGTPYNALDDTYTFDLTVTSENAPSVAYGLNGSGAYLYGATNTFGPFPINDANLTFEVADLGGPGCYTSFTIEEPPVTCSDACGISVDDVMLTCADEGGPSAGRLTVEVLVSNLNAASSGWTTADGISGSYGEYVAIGTVAQGGSNFSFTIAEVGREACRVSQTVSSPEITAICPEEVESLFFPMTYLTFESLLASGADAGAEQVGDCYLPDFGGIVDLPTSRLTVTASSANQGEREVLTLYLFGSPGQGLTAAAFAQRAEESLTCDNLSGILVAASNNPNSKLPALPATLIPVGMTGYGSLTLDLRRGESFSLVTTASNNVSGNSFTYVAVLENGSLVDIHDLTGTPVVAERTSAATSYPISSDQALRWSNAPTSLAVLGTPVVENACGPVVFGIRDTIVGTCGSARMIRRFDLTLADTVLRNICQQEFTVNFVTISDLVWPRARYRFDCDERYSTLENGYPSPAYTGYPIVYRDGVALPLDGQAIDQLTYGFVDEEATNNNGERVLSRRWTVLDGCENREVEFLQTFLLEGGGQPFFVCPISNHYCPIVEENIMLWGMDELDCAATIELPEPEINGLCDSTGWDFTTDVFSISQSGDTVLVVTLNADDERTLRDLTAGDYLLYYSGRHDQESIEGRFCRFRVADLENPTAVCRANVNVSLPGNGLIRIATPLVDLGSYDNCQVDEIGLRVRSSGVDTTAFEPFLIFDCEDVGSMIRVDLRITDLAGNENFCTANVLILDNTNPICTGLSSITISCADLPDSFNAYDTTQLQSLFGLPDVVDNCAAFATELPPAVSGNACNPDNIRRAFRAVDQNGNLSRDIFYQTITVTPVLGYAIEFPKDTVVECAADVTPARLTGAACDSITVTHTDELLTANAGDCQLIQRTYVVTSWCEWGGAGAATLIGREENCNNAAGLSNIWVVRTPTGAFVDTDGNSANREPAAGACGNNPAGHLRELSGGGSGRYVYTQLIRIQDESAPEVVVSVPDSVCTISGDCTAEVLIGITVPTACAASEGRIAIEVDLNADGTVDGAGADFGAISGAYPDYRFNATLPVGLHTLAFILSDACGNETTETRSVVVRDCYVPLLFALEDRNYILEEVPESDQNASALVSATDLAACVVSDCSGSLSYSVNRIGEPADINRTSLLLTCEDRYRISLEVYVWDDAVNPFSIQPDGSIGGPNWRMRTISVRLTDPGQLCTDCQVGDAITMNGRIVTRTGQPMQLVSIDRGDGPATVSDRFGSYQLRGETGGQYVLSASIKSADRQRGLSATDMLILRRHILGLSVIADPYQRLAADLNQDGLVNVLDMLNLQGLILGDERRYPATSPWLFVNATWDGRGDPILIIPVNDTQYCSDGHDFIGVRLGDLNGSAGADHSMLVGN